jgi:exodeoxyribonuclease III
MRLVSWNVNGLRAVHGRGDLSWAFDADDVDVICLQETKIQPDAVTEEMRTPKSPTGTWQSFWTHGKKKGYSGTAVYVRDRFVAKPFDFTVGGTARPDFDDEGRVVSVDLGPFVLFNIYFPNGASGSDRLLFKREFHNAFLDKMIELKKTRSIVVTGDLNIGHKEIDVAKPQAWGRYSGFLPEERAWVDKFLAAGFIDTFRAEKGDIPRQYTFWETRVDARKKNEGWRIDYFFASSDLEEKLVDAWISPQIMGSDHCPVGVELAVTPPLAEAAAAQAVVTEEWGDEEPADDDEDAAWRRR